MRVQIALIEGHRKREPRWGARLGSTFMLMRQSPPEKAQNRTDHKEGKYFV
jgi:hypothetical protein